MRVECPGSSFFHVFCTLSLRLSAGWAYDLCRADTTVPWFTLIGDQEASFYQYDRNHKANRH